MNYLRRNLRAGFALLTFGSLNFQAATTQFTIDPTQSTVGMEGSVGQIPLQAQGPGSLSTHFSGTINAAVTGANIQFTGGSAIAAVTNGVWSPGAGGSGPAAPADYAGQVTLPFGTAKGALRNLVLDVTSPSLALTGGSFDASNLIFGFPASSTASFDYDAGILGHKGIALRSNSTNRVATGATVATIAGVQTLTIPVDATFQFTAISTNDSTAHLTGKLVATATPQPTLSSIGISQGTVTLHAQNASSTPNLQSSTNLTSWAAQQATHSTDANGDVYTFPATGPSGFYRLSK